jgi:hypothetical protein
MVEIWLERCFVPDGWNLSVGRYTEAGNIVPLGRIEQAMAFFKVNPIMCVVSVILTLGGLAYYIYMAIDRVGGECRTAVAKVAGKQYTPGCTKLNNMDQIQTFPDTYALCLDVNGESTVGLVTKDKFDSLNANDTVQVKIRRTRLTQKLLVIDVTR